MKKHRLATKEYWKDLFILFFTFFKMGAFCFGGGYAMLSLIESYVVEKHHWLTHDELSDIFAIAESTPGPIAINTATFVGTKRLGVLGGIVATLGVVLPAWAIIIGVSYILNIVKDNVWVSYLFKGIKVGVLILISKAVIKFYKDMRKNVFSFILMLAAFSIVFFTNVSVIYVILATIVICTIATAFRYYYHKRFYHSVGTPPYYNERIGKALEKDEYVREIDALTTQNSADTIPQEIAEGGQEV